MKKNNLLEQFDLAVEQVISSDSTEDIVKGIENEESSVSKGLEIRFKILELNHLTQDQDMRIK